MNNNDDTARAYFSISEIARQITIMNGAKEFEMGKEAALDFGRIICTNHGSDPVAIDLALANLPLTLKAVFLKGYQEVAQKALDMRLAEAELELSRMNYFQSEMA